MGISFLDSKIIEPQPESDLSIIRQGDDFSYEIKGFEIDDKIIPNGLVFSDELYIQECDYINHEYLLVKPDRISVSFL